MAPSEPITPSEPDVPTTPTEEPDVPTTPKDDPLTPSEPDIPLTPDVPTTPTETPDVPTTPTETPDVPTDSTGEAECPTDFPTELPEEENKPSLFSLNIDDNNTLSTAAVSETNLNDGIWETDYQPTTPLGKLTKFFINKVAEKNNEKEKTKHFSITV